MVEASELTIYPTRAFLVTTSDGWVNDKSMPVENQRGLLEFKCPYLSLMKLLLKKTNRLEYLFFFKALISN